jgi:CubicO group peptidase (beta-lactamase class C family)
MSSLAAVVDGVAESTRFSGVVRVDVAGETVLERAYGLADRAYGVAMTPSTRIGVASGAKPFTALTVVRLVEDGVLSLDTRVRDLLGDDLPLIDDDVTVEHLLSHRSGIGDYFREDELDDMTSYALSVPVHQLDSAESYLSVLDGHPQVFAPGTSFTYCDGGFCVLALIAERLSGVRFQELVRQQVIEPAGLAATAYLRSDELPGDAARGYLYADGLRTNVLHLPVVGGGDGGIYTTAGDVHALFAALEAGRVVAPATREEMFRSRGHLERTDDLDGYGLGFWRWGDAVALEGYDAGASLRSLHLPGRATWSVLSNTTEGAWPVATALDAAIVGDGPPDRLSKVPGSRDLGP